MAKSLTAKTAEFPVNAYTGIENDKPIHGEPDGSFSSLVNFYVKGGKLHVRDATTLFRWAREWDSYQAGTVKSMETILSLSGIQKTIETPYDYDGLLIAGCANGVYRDKDKLIDGSYIPNFEKVLSFGSPYVPRLTLLQNTVHVTDVDHVYIVNRTYAGEPKVDAPTAACAGEATAEIPPLKTYVITANCDENSTLTPSGGVAVQEEAAVTFTITPNATYTFYRWEVDGSGVYGTGSGTLTDGTTWESSDTTFTFTFVKGNHILYGSSYGQGQDPNPKTNYSLTLTKDGHIAAYGDGGSGPGTYTVVDGNYCTFYCEDYADGIDPNYAFDRWEIDTVGMSNYTTRTLTDGTTCYTNGKVLTVANVKGNHAIACREKNKP